MSRTNKNEKIINKISRTNKFGGGNENIRCEYIWSGNS